MDETTGVLTSDNQQRLDALIAELETLPTAERILQSADLLCPFPRREAEKKRLRSAMAGAFAAERTMYYLVALRSVNEERKRLNKLIEKLRLVEAQALSRRDAEGVDTARVEQIALSGMVEVALHTFAVYVSQIEMLLPIATRSVSATIASRDLAFLRSYRQLRDHYEHFDERLPGKSKSQTYVTESESQGAWSFIAGLSVDPEGRFDIAGTKVDVTDRGLTQVEAIVQTAWEEINQKSIERVKKILHEESRQHSRSRGHQI